MKPKRKRKEVGADDWRAAKQMLEWMLDADDGEGGATGWSHGVTRWYVWWIDPEGLVVITPHSVRSMRDWLAAVALVQGVCAEEGVPCGVGVITEAAGSLHLGVYTPPAWPEVPDEGGGYRRVSVEWPDDDTIWAVLR